MTDLKQEIVAKIDPIEFWKKEFPTWDGTDNARVLCPFHKDQNPSLCISWTGKAVCSCGYRCTSVVGYYTDRYCGGNIRKALRVLYSRYVQQTFEKEALLFWRDALLEKRKLIHALQRHRGWNLETIKRFGLGWSAKNKRVSIPILTMNGFCVDIRWHDSFKLHKGKDGKRIPVLAHSRNSKNHQWFPFLKDYNAFDSQVIWLFEGEPDTILAVQEGLPALTVTGGAGAWRNLPYDKLKAFEGKDVVICLDNDTTGKSAAEELSRQLMSVEVASVKCLTVPHGKDFTEYLLNHGGSAKALQVFADNTPYAYRSAVKDVRAIALSDTASSEWAGRWVRTDVLVSGRSAAPFLIPERLKFSCRVGDGNYCANCPCSDEGFGRMTVTSQDDEVLEWIFAREHDKVIRAIHGCDKRGRVDVEVERYQAVQRVTMVPALNRNTSDGEYCQRVGFVVGKPVEANQQYAITARPLPHPRTRDAVLVVNDSKPSRDSLEGFSLAAHEIFDLKAWMRNLAHPLKGRIGVLHTLRTIANLLSTEATQIVGRWIAHSVVDLCFHSPLNLVFGGSRLPKGTIEVILFGDTRTGKGTIVEGMMRYYDAGTVVNGENTSLMGLLGGALKLPEGGHALSWGALPLNNGRLVAIDEFSGLKEDILGNLSRIRSEGIAEMHKAGIHDSTSANVRIIWMANPRKGVEVSHFGYGVEGIMDLVRTQEDVARFDIATVLAKEDVDATKINKIVSAEHNEMIRVMLRNCLRWAWSRKEDQITFTREATSAILGCAMSLSRMFSSAIPLIQAENVRHKLAKIAAAIALRCFSTKDGVTCIVTEEHVHAAAMFLKLVYRQKSTGYLEYSAIEKQLHILDTSALEAQFDSFSEGDRKILVHGLLNTERFRANNICDWIAVDAAVARSFIGIWVRVGAIEPNTDGSYKKRARFVAWLQKRK